MTVLAQIKVPVISQMELVFVIQDFKEICVKVIFLANKCTDVRRNNTSNIIGIRCFGPDDCSNHGTCNFSTGTCACDPGFQGDICQGNKPIFHMKPKP